MPRVTSTAVEEVRYTPQKRWLDVWYTGGKGYRYLRVPSDAYEALLAAPSIGIFVNQEIKPRYAFTRNPPRSGPAAAMALT